MFQGKTLVQLAQEITRQAEAKRDFIADTRKVVMTVTPDGGGDFSAPALQLEGAGSFGIKPTGHRQIAEAIKIPKPYYDRLLQEAPELLTRNVNHWLQAQPQQRLVRTLDGDVRALLSDRYRPLDNYDLLNAALPIVQENGAQVISCEVTERRLFLKCLLPKVEGEVARGDVVQAGLVISNSEIGDGSLKVEPLIYRLVCLNGMVTNAAMKRYHVGGRIAGGLDEVAEVFTDKTRQLTDAAFWSQVRDVVAGAFSRDLFEANLERMRQAAEDKITGNVVAAAQVVEKKFGLTNKLGGDVLQELIKAGDLSRWGMVNAITAQANVAQDYDQATELERLGGTILELSPRDWKAIAEAQLAA